MSDLIAIQDFCVRKDTEPMICSFETETISAPTSPILHSMARMWLINDGEATVLINNREYCLRKGSCVGILPWQITEIIEVKSPITFYLVVYYYDNVNEIIKTFYNPGGGYPDASDAKDYRSTNGRIEWAGLSEDAGTVYAIGGRST